MPCSCNNGQPKGLNQANGSVATGTTAAPVPADSLIRVIYNGPPGQHMVAFGKQNYGYRRGGDVFYVRAEHVAQYPAKFSPIAEVVLEQQTTPVPPPPPVVDLEVA